MTDITDDDQEFRDMVLSQDGLPVTTSLKVAQRFGKAHGKVLRAIRELSCSKDFNRANFGSIEYVDSKGRPQAAYQMTKDGWMFLVMGFSGEKAAARKEKFIRAFNWMADELRNKNMSFEYRRNSLMLEYQQEKGMASFAGRTLRRWQIKKPGLEGKILAIQHDGQHKLQLN
ncbi:Rha family transcriptional regulator [Pseudomonas canadensis]|uniref:Rha family transcriptional regulator n=1 Tax=Pseudomonas canadensis TaxID=915099 RepID=UPI00336A6E12